MKILDFPKLRQTFDYDCGAKSLQAVLDYYGITVCEDVILKIARINARDGALIKGMCSFLKRTGLRYDSKSMTVSDLKSYIDQRIPVIVLLQAWSSKVVDYESDFSDGHWVVVIGYSRDKFFFEDPYSFEHTFLGYKELESRWHAKEGKKLILNHGIAVFGKKASYDSKKVVHMD